MCPAGGGGKRAGRGGQRVATMAVGRGQGGGVKGDKRSQVAGRGVLGGEGSRGTPDGGKHEGGQAGRQASR